MPGDIRYEIQQLRQKSQRLGNVMNRRESTLPRVKATQTLGQHKFDVDRSFIKLGMLRHCVDIGEKGRKVLVQFETGAVKSAAVESSLACSGTVRKKGQARIGR